ncbi:MerR family transcriptional regulator [Bacillus pseudomycoides]|uniref:MerR family transcriptional regulator n=1 Tax=Bacillus pseudomycoides TaxID=64104 RepID=A0ABD6TAU1_9BACI|nr:MerR family transcriptional regulator [Bacillus pseudomycoides]MEB3057560.1 MerR family transcriptional regulator [Bacillus pseudomycoides]PHE96367.1 MerR family transcriptional regulator [Bacillus pseudomycoides]
MKKQLLTVKDIVQITGITKRTLQYYDKINLLKPIYLTENGYRIYDRNSLAKLQTILFFKEMDFSLKEIADILKLTREEQQKLLKKHNQTLLLKKQRLETIITTVDEYVSGKDIYNLNFFNNSSILPLQEQYAHEAKFIYGETEKYKEFEGKLKKLSPSEKANLFSEFELNMEKVFRKIASCINQSPSSDKVQKLIVEWKSYLEQSIVCDSEMLTCIANTYKFDNRFKNYINQFSNEDLAEFLYNAIIHYTNRQNR